MLNHFQGPQMEIEQVRALLAGIRLFQGVTSRQLDELASKARHLRLPRRSLLIKSGQRVHELYSLLEGSLKVYLLSCSGQQRVIRLIQGGDNVGESLLVNQSPSTVYVETLSVCRMLVIPSVELLDLMAENPQVSMAMIRSLSSKTQGLMRDLESCCLQNSLQRIAQYLCTLGCHCKHQGDRIDLPASKAVVASLLNLSPETFSRGLHQLVAANYISIERRRIQLHDMEALKRVAGGIIQLG